MGTSGEKEPRRELSLLVQLLIALAVIGAIAAIILARKDPIFASGEDEPAKGQQITPPSGP